LTWASICSDKGVRILTQASSDKDTTLLGLSQGSSYMARVFWWRSGCFKTCFCRMFHQLYPPQPYIPAMTVQTNAEAKQANSFEITDLRIFITPVKHLKSEFFFPLLCMCVFVKKLLVRPYSLPRGRFKIFRM